MLFVLAFLGGVGWTTSFAHTLRAQKLETDSHILATSEVHARHEAALSSERAEVMLWVHAFERIGYPVIVAAFLGLALYAGGQAHIRLMRESLTDVREALKNLANRVDDVDVNVKHGFADLWAMMCDEDDDDAS
jgi:hypothetical protein